MELNFDSVQMITRSRKRKQAQAEEQQRHSATTTSPSTKKRRLLSRSQAHTASVEKKAGISDCPAEVLEQIFAYVDAKTLIHSCSVINKQWYKVISGAPWQQLQKWVYKEITVSGLDDFEVKLERNVHSDNTPKTDAERADPKKPRRLIKSIRREKPKVSELPSLLRHISCKKLIFQSLRETDLRHFLKVFTTLCLDTSAVSFDFCIFQKVKKETLCEFFKPRQNRLMEVGLSSCRDLEECLSQEQFLEYVGQLTGKYQTFKLKDHYAESPWKNRLAEIILDTRPFWILELDGVSPPLTAIENRLKRWLRPNEAVEETGQPPLDCLSSEGYDIRRKDVIIKLENSKTIRVSSWYSKCLQILPYPVQHSNGQIPTPQPNKVGKVWAYWRNPPMICKVLEMCFDGRRRYSAHRSKIVVTDLDQKRFSLYLQR